MSVTCFIQLAPGYALRLPLGVCIGRLLAKSTCLSRLLRWCSDVDGGAAQLDEERQSDTRRRSTRAAALTAGDCCWPSSPPQHDVLLLSVDSAMAFIRLGKRRGCEWNQINPKDWQKRVSMFCVRIKKENYIKIKWNKKSISSKKCEIKFFGNFLKRDCKVS